LLLRGQYPDTVDSRITIITGKKGEGCESPLPFLSSRSDHEPSPISGVKQGFSSDRVNVPGADWMTGPNAKQKETTQALRRNVNIIRRNL
jgi:hypothetical protein